MIQTIQKHFTNLSLKNKILLVILLNIILLSFSSSVGLHINSRASDQLLYHALANSLAYSADQLSNHLSNVETMSFMILSNESIQKNLSTIKDSSNPLERSEAYKRLYSVISEYAQTYRSNKVSYIDLRNSSYTTHSNPVLSKKVPNHIQQELFSLGEAGEGAPCWITKYGNEYGIFLCRSIRRIKFLSLDNLGVLIACIDIGRLVQSCTEFNNQYGDTLYFLFNEDELIYHSPEFSSASARQIQKEMTSSYNVLQIQGHNYFAVSGKIPGPDWTYILMVPHDPITCSLQFSRRFSILMSAVSILLSLFLANKILNSLFLHFQTLVNKMKAFANNESIPSVSNICDYSQRTDEIGILHTQFDYMASKIQSLIQTNYVNELLKKEAQIKALENQINPHFLYNTLESINWRAKAIQEHDISAMVEALGYLLRTTLNRHDTSYTLKQELDLIQHYIIIQKIRFEDRLTFILSTDPDVSLNMLFPKLIIQPLVENALNYALETSNEPCLIQVSIHQEPDFLHIYVKNNNSVFEEGLLEKLEENSVSPHGFGIGLLNIQKRLRLSYGADAKLLLYNKNHMAVAEIILPQTQISENKEPLV